MAITAYTVTWNEMLDAINRGEAVHDIEGYLIGSKDRKIQDYREAYAKHARDIVRAVKEGRDVPLAVRVALLFRACNARTTEDKRHLYSQMPPAKNKKGKNFAWSFTAVQQHETCGMQYAAERYYGYLKFTETEATIWGNRVHKALEMRLKNGSPLPDGMKQWDKYCKAFEASAAKNEGTIYPELAITLNRHGDMVDWFSKEAYVRCKLDVVIDCGEVVYIYDWKTGKKKDNPLQLKTNAAMAAIRFPNAKRFVTKYIWLKEEGAAATSGEDYTIEDIPGFWKDLAIRAAEAEQSWRDEEFICRPSGLCYGWCGHMKCKHWKPKRG